MNVRHADKTTLSAFEGISTTQRLSRLSSLQPPLEAFEPYLIHPRKGLEDPMAVTACMWIQDPENFDELYSWASLWGGMIYIMPLSDLNVVKLIQCRANLALDDYYCCTQLRSSHSYFETHTRLQNTLANSWVVASSVTPYSSRSGIPQYIPQHREAICDYENSYARSCESFFLATDHI